MVVSLVLIGNTIRLAIYARRREIGIMRLVGASNWFIRTPFLMEGVLQSLIGSILAILTLLAAQAIIVPWLRSNLAFIPVNVSGSVDGSARGAAHRFGRRHRRRRLGRGGRALPEGLAVRRRASRVAHTREVVTIMKRGIVALVAVLVGIALVLSSFIGGILFERASAIDIPGVSAVLQPQDGSDIGGLTKQVHDIIQDEALEPSSDESMTTNAIDGMLNSLGDKYAAYFSAKDYADFKDMQKGEFFGIGLTIGLSKDGQPQVGQVFDGTPAAKAGLKSGDLLLAVNGTHKAKWDLDDFVKRVRGPLGTKVTLEVKRGTAAPFSVIITRDRIVVPNTETKSFGPDVALRPPHVLQRAVS